MTCLMMAHLGVYALGAADDDERRRIEAHLPACPQCRAELARLEPLPGLLAKVPADMVPVLRLARARRARRARRAAAIAAAAAVMGAAGGYWLAPRAGGPSPAALTMAARNPATHVRATARLTATSWGTSIQLEVTGVPLNQLCELIVSSRAGETEVAGFWDAWSTGPVSVPASAAWRPSDIASIRVATATRTLLIIAMTDQNGLRRRSGSPPQT